MRNIDQVTDMKFFSNNGGFVLPGGFLMYSDSEGRSPEEPITINLNIKLDADIRVKLEEEAKKDIATNPGIF